MLKKMLFSFIVIFSYSVFADSYISVFQKEVNDVCAKASSILIKKSVLDILKSPTDKSCKGPFISNLVDQCDAIDCQGLLRLFSQVKGITSGNIVGR